MRTRTHIQVRILLLGEMAKEQGARFSKANEHLNIKAAVQAVGPVRELRFFDTIRGAEGREQGAATAEMANEGSSPCIKHVQAVTIRGIGLCLVDEEPSEVFYLSLDRSVQLCRFEPAAFKYTKSVFMLCASYLAESPLRLCAIDQACV